MERNCTFSQRERERERERERCCESKKGDSAYDLEQRETHTERKKDRQIRGKIDNKLKVAVCV